MNPYPSVRESGESPIAKSNPTYPCRAPAFDHIHNRDFGDLANARIIAGAGCTAHSVALQPDHATR